MRAMVERDWMAELQTGQVYGVLAALVAPCRDFIVCIVPKTVEGGDAVQR
jgi:hypothetical protein